MCLQNQHDVLHYLDDFLAVCRTNPEAEAFTRYFFDLCKDLGIAVKKNKTGHVIDFLGIELDTMLMEAWLPTRQTAQSQRPRQTGLAKIID